MQFAVTVCKLHKSFENTAVGKFFVIERDYTHTLWAEQIIKIHTECNALELLSLCKRIYYILFSSGKPLSL